jgi:WD40 repeat protein
MATVCPYPGLRAFESREAGWFFGREETVAHLVDRLCEQLDIPSPLFVLGPSGVGKSSLLRAGLVPALRAGLLAVPRSRNWPRVLLRRPGARPMAMLTRAVMGGTGLSGSAGGAGLSGDPAATARLLTDHMLGRGGPTAGLFRRFVLVVDQFEEIFTLCRDENERAQFTGTLLALVQPRTDTRGRQCPAAALVVAGVRSDFYSDCTAVTGLGPLLPDNQVVVGPLEEPDLRRAITGPAAAVGCAVEPGLTELLLADIGHGPGQAGRHEPGELPLLAYALRATWDRCAGKTLTVAGYRDVGGVHGAVAQEAERIYADFPPDTQALTRRIMLRLVSVGPGTQQARQRVARAALLAGLDSHPAETVLARFTQARLLTADADGVEMSHEAFLSAWPRLREWIAEDREGLRLHRQLAQDAQNWEREDKDPGSLYRGSRLANAIEWRSAPGREADLTTLEREFLDASSKAQEMLRAAEERARIRERQRSRRLRALALALAVLLAVSLTSAAIAIRNGQVASSQRQQAIAGQLAAQSDAAVTTNLGTADMEALAAWRAGHTFPARSSLLSREGDPYLASFPEKRGAATQALAVSQNGRFLAAAEAPSNADVAATSVQLWDLAARKTLAVFRGLGADVFGLAFSPDSRTLTAILEQNQAGLRSWNVTTHRPVPPPVHEADAVSALAYSATAPLFAAAVVQPRHGRAGRFRPSYAVIDLWNLANHRLIRRIPAGPGVIESVAFSPGGRLLAAGGTDNRVRLWNVASGVSRDVFRADTGGVASVEFSPDGRTLASASRDGTVRAWNLTTGKSSVAFDYNEGTPSIAFSSQGQYLYAADSEFEVGIYDLTAHELVTPAYHVETPDNALAASPAGNTLVLGNDNGPLLALEEGSRVFRDPSNAGLISLAVAPGGRLAATGATDGTIQLWHTSNPAAARVLAGPRADMDGIAFSPDGRLLATSDDYCTIRLWDVSTGRQRAVVHIPTALPAADLDPGLSVSQVAFGPQGKTVAGYCSTYGTTLHHGVSLAAHDSVGIWNTATRKPVTSYGWGAGGVSAGFAYDPDGHTLALGTATGAVLLWDTRTHQITGRIHTGQGVGSTAFAFSPNGRLLATSGHDTTIRFWRMPSGAPAGGIGPTGAFAHYLAFSLDGRTLAASSTDPVLRVWDVAGKHLIATMTAYPMTAANQTEPNGFNQVTFVTNQTLISVNSDGTARLWQLSPASEAQALCAALNGPTFAGQWQALSPRPATNPCHRH